MKENTEASQKSIISALKWANKERGKLIGILTNENYQLQAEVDQLNQAVAETMMKLKGAINEIQN